jgi:Fe-S-cluster-containing dehydrogenase component/CRP-like cAMP-binding protein
MPRENNNHEQVIDAFSKIDMVSELIEKAPNGEFLNELDMDIILFGRSYRGKQVGPYVRLLDFLPGEVIIKEGSWESGIFYILVKGRLEAFITLDDGQQKKVGEIPEGNTFGEMALLAGTRRVATVVVAKDDGPASVLEFTRPALRLLRKLPRFAKTLDRNYRTYGLMLSLNELRDFSRRPLEPDILKKLDESARFSVYEKDHVLFREGDPINRVVYVRNGWIERVSGAAYNPNAADLLIDTDNAVGLDLLGAGSCLGLEAIDTPKEWGYTATVRGGRTEVVEIAISRLREQSDLRAVVVPILESSAGGDDSPVPLKSEDKRALLAANSEIETGVADGINVLVMDMAKCIRCGNCSRACHQVHGRSRLVRRGVHIERPTKPTRSKTQSVLVPSVCMHCQDPECLTGCPTGAIARFPGGEIDIHPATCIGCGDCASQCPYNAISMVPAQESAVRISSGSALARLRSVFPSRKSNDAAPVTQTEDLLAVKCNLCRNTGLNPPGAKSAAYSCEENCPTGALVRVNPHEYFDEVNNTFGLIQQSKTHAIGVNIHKFDLWSVIWHVIGIAAVVLVGGAGIWATRVFSQDVALSAGSWVTVRWLTGLTGLAGIVWTMAYPARKQIYRRRAGALRYWMLSHVYMGVLAGVLLLAHGSQSSGGIFSALLMISFDLVIVSGLFGAACYLFVPRFMTRIEREPLLLEDLRQRRRELRADLVRASDYANNENLRNLILGKVRRRFLGLGYLFRQYYRKEELPAMLAEARQEFRGAAEGMSRADDAHLMEAVEKAATLRRIDALCYLHQLLKIWVAPHVLFTSIMLALMLIHIAQVTYFNVR